jgi:tetratricopeptide (TPR) repeat protein
MTMYVWRLVLLGLFLILPPEARAVCKPKYVELPITMVGTRPMISAQVNGEKVRLVADTGAFYSMLTPGAAEELKLTLRPNPYNMRVSGIGGSTETSIAVVRQFTLGEELTQTNVEFLVGGGDATGGGVGLLGQNIWGHFDDEYDLADGYIRIFRNSGCERTPMAYWATSGAYSVMDLDSFADLGRKIGGYASVNGKRIRVQFDSGAFASGLTFAAARRAGIDPYGPGSSPGGYTRGIGRRLIETRIVPVDVFEIGGEKIEHTRLRLANTDDLRTDMLLGADFFLSHRIYVANEQNKIYFTYNGGPVFNLRPQFATDAPPAAAPAATAVPSPAAAANDSAAPKDAAAYARRGAASLGRQDYGAAIADLTKAHEMEPGKADYLYQRAIAYRDNRQPFLAMADFDAALTLDPGSIDAHVARAAMRLAGRQTAGAIADLDAADKLAAKPADVRLTLAELYSRAEAFAPASAQFDIWIHEHDDDSRLEHALAGRCWSGAMSGADLGRALGACDSALRRAAKDPLALDGRGFVRLRQGGDLDKAIADFDAALAVQPKIAWALWGRGLAEQRQGKTDAAKADLAAAAAVRPQIGETAKARGIAS